MVEVLRYIKVLLDILSLKWGIHHWIINFCYAANFQLVLYCFTFLLLGMNNTKNLDLKNLVIRDTLNGSQKNRELAIWRWRDNLTYFKKHAIRFALQDPYKLTIFFYFYGLQGKEVTFNFLVPRPEWLRIMLRNSPK